jgi:hypothetical protein
VHRFEAALRLLDDACRVYQYLCKRRIEPISVPRHASPVVDEALKRHAEHLNARRDELYDITLHLVVVFEGLRRRPHTSTQLRAFLRRPRAALQEWLSARTTFAVVESELGRALAQFHQKASAFEVQLADSIRPARLRKSDGVRSGPPSP